MTTPDMQQVMDNELALLTSGVRRDPSKVAALLAPDFEEIGASGRLWTRESMILALALEPSADDVIQATEMRCAQLSPDLILLTYVSDPGDRRVRRTSLWRRTDGRWLLRFHQGTPSAS